MNVIKPAPAAALTGDAGATVKLHGSGVAVGLGTRVGDGVGVVIGVGVGVGGWVGEGCPGIVNDPDPTFATP